MPTTIPPTTSPLQAAGLVVMASICPKTTEGVIHVRAWIEDYLRKTVSVAIGVADSECVILDEDGELVGSVVGQVDPAGTEYVLFEIPGQLAAEHAYRARVRIYVPLYDLMTEGHIPVPTVR